MSLLRLTMTLVALLCGAAVSIDMPIWPKQYRLRGTWSIPYQGIHQPFLVYTDNIKGRQVESVYNGLQHNVHILNYRKMQLQPHDDHVTCTFSDAGEEDSLIDYLPSDSKNYKYKGIHVVLGRKCHMWQKDIENLGWYYRIYCDVDTLDPVRIFNHGVSIRGSHPADYIFDIYEFGVTLDENAFAYPPNCINTSVVGPSKYNFGFHKNLRSNSESCPVRKVEEEPELPKNFTWRTNPHVLPPPRDQANCGSCWAQGAAQGLSAAFSLKRGNLTVVSVSQINDCTWADSNRACQGGETDLAFRILIDQKRPIALEEELPYTGVAGYCSPSVERPLGVVTGCWHVEQHNEEQLKRAVYLHGPIAVAIRAGYDAFVQYQGGVFESEETTEAMLDHVVTLTGWGVAPDGRAFWEIQNSWSDVWGDEGFGYLSMDPKKDSGVTLDAFVAEVALTETK